MGIRARIDPQHLFVCCKRPLNWAVHLMRPAKSRSRVRAGVVRLTPPLSLKAQGAGVTERSDSRRKLTPGSLFYVEM
jgi:hypothetical protein